MTECLKLPSTSFTSLIAVFDLIEEFVVVQPKSLVGLITPSV